MATLMMNVMSFLMAAVATTIILQEITEAAVIHVVGGKRGWSWEVAACDRTFYAMWASQRRFVVGYALGAVPYPFSTI